MDTSQSLFCLSFSVIVCFISCTFINVPNHPSWASAWIYQYDETKGLLAMRNNYHPIPNDTCHVYKLTDQQRHDIHTISGEFKVEIMMYEAIMTKHGEKMTAGELNNTSYRLWKYCERNLHFLKYNFYV
ncbi:uncharacterized protein LOC125664254 [Ostrea edulis]|uniref:uncharacterized protein LOC125664254 n=1 Tax=Ostrea edulis TaxID=37623 RepID=UPI0020952D00|nr:uncharacterized protein LOC125664254 [Ostrea edulis]